MMKKLLIAFTLFASFLTPRSFAAFEDKGTGARATALGDTYVAVGNDVLSLAYNPAGLARVQQKEMTSEYAKLFAGLSDGSSLSQSYLAYGQPIQWGGTLAISWKQFTLDDLYKERTLSLGYGEWLTPKIAVGGALKQLYHEFGVPNMIVDNNGNVTSGRPNFFAQYGNSNTAYSVDLGVQYLWTDRNTIGISIQDINEPNIALSSQDHEKVARTYRFGIDHKYSRHTTFAGALQSRQYLAGQRDTILTGSAERHWDLDDGDQVTLRGSLANGSREFRQLAMGGGYRLLQFQFDYAFVFNLGGITLGDTSGTHRISLTYRFGSIGTATKAAKAKKQKQMPQGYEPAVHEIDERVSPEPETRFPETKKRKSSPRSADITVTPEDIDESGAVPRSAEISIDAIFDTDYDGIPDDRDLCPDTAPGAVVDANGCAESQRDHHGNPLPRRVKIDIIPLDQIENGH